MRAWFIDAYRSEDKVVLWMKTPDKDFRVERTCKPEIHLDATEEARSFLEHQGYKYSVSEKKTYTGRKKKVYSIPAPVKFFEAFVRHIERGTNYRVPLYDADITPELRVMYDQELKPFNLVEIMEDGQIVTVDDDPPTLVSMELKIDAAADFVVEPGCRIRSIVVDGKILEQDDEEALLRAFAGIFSRKDPDVVIIERAYAKLPYLISRLERYGIHVAFNRWDERPIRYRGGRPFYSYGRVLYKDFSIKLNGRFLMDTNTQMGSGCSTASVVELCQLSGASFQQIAGRSFGAVFQIALMREMAKEGILVPYKEKPLEKPISLLDMLKWDAAGLRLDPKVGFHTDVAEIDFSSMFPWIIFNHNISAETILSDEPPFEELEGAPFKVSLAKKGLVPRTIKPFIDRRMYYKRHPSAINKEKAKGLKWVLVTSYGYLRFREFKLGLATAHALINAYAREILLQAMRLAEDKGFEIIHGIVDSLYIRKPGLNEMDVRGFCSDLELLTGIPVSMEGIFDWIVFLPSINDNERPVPSKYYGFFRNGELKARAIELRQPSQPLFVRAFQENIIQILRTCKTRKDVLARREETFRTLRKFVKMLPFANAQELSLNLRISKVEYKNNIAQRQILQAMQRRNISAMPGQVLFYVYGESGAVLPDEFNGRPDLEKYTLMLARALYVLLQPFGIKREAIVEALQDDRQTDLFAFASSQEMLQPHSVSIRQ